MSGIQVSGLLSNSAFDWKSIVDQLIAAEGVPITKLNAEKTKNTDQATALTAINTSLQELQDAVQSMRTGDIFSSRTVTSDLANTTWKCSSVTGAATGSYTFDVTQLATQANLRGSSDIGAGLRNAGNSAGVLGVQLNQLALSPAITAGNFTVNGALVTVAQTDSLQDVFDAISSATGGIVTGSYDYATDKVTLSGVDGAGVVSGTSNLVTALKLTDSGGGVYASSAAVGAANTVADLSLANLPTATVVTAGTFTVAGKQVLVELTDSLQDVFDKISAATSGTVTASYDHNTDQVTLTKASGELVLGAGNDSSNFLAVMKLTNRVGYASTSSTAALGSVKSTATLENAGLRSAITAVDGSGSGSFTINGVSVAYNVKTDTLNSVINRINDAGAGVVAAYDSANDRVVLSNRDTGDVGITVDESTGGLLDAMGLTSLANGTLVHGQNAQFKFNGSTVTLTSKSNTLDASVHGVAGLSVTINTTTKQALQVESDTIAMEGAINGFIEKFNAVQDVIEEKTKVTVNGTTVSGAVLSNNREVETWANRLRSLAFDAVGGLTGDISRLDHIGIDFDSTTGHLKVKDSGKLATALGDGSEEVELLFLKPSTGLVSRFYSYLTELKAASRGQTDGLATANSDLDEQIATLQARLDSQRETLTNSFIRMLDAQSNAQTQNTYLTNTFFKDTSNN